MPYQMILKRFQADGKRLKLYTSARDKLLRAGVDGALTECAGMFEADPSDPNALQIAALLHAKQAGYMQCIADLFDLDNKLSGTESELPRDYGALEDLKDEYDSQQIQKLKGNIE